MSFKKNLKSKRAQGMMEYLGVAMAIAAALLATSLLPRVQNAFRDNNSVLGIVDQVIINDFGATVGE